jgi:uncharacterized protein YkwD
MRILFLVTFLALVTVSWTHPAFESITDRTTVFMNEALQTQSIPPFSMLFESPAATNTVAPTPPALDNEPSLKQSAPPASVAKENPVPKKETPKISPPPPPAPKPAPAPPPLAPPPSPTPEPQSFVTTLEVEVHARVNITRNEYGLAPVAYNALLATIARGHSADMLARDYFDHDSPEGCDMACRADATGYKWQAVGENIYMMSGYALDAEKLAAMVISGWMNSPGHRANILKEVFTYQGIGVAVRGEDVYVTEMLANPL